MLSQLKKNKLFFCCFIFFTSLSIIDAQTFSTTFKIGKNPTNQNFWWTKNNNFGLKNYSNYQKTKININSLDFEIKLNLYSNLKDYKSLVFNESYLKFNFNKNSFLRIGKYYRDFSTYINDELSSGSILVSHNAQAMPKVGWFSENDFKRNKKISLNYGIAHGIFDKNDVYSSSPYLHEKFVYLNIKNEGIIFSLGFVHEAIWGGEINNNHEFSGKQPQSISDFLKIFISADGPNDYPHANALGNHLGIWDFSFQKKFTDKNLKVYYQHIFEDTSGLRFENKTDGLWGIELDNYIKNTAILLEYINTKNQYRDPPYVQENYFNHGLYSYGWSYKNYTLGNPFISHQNPIATDFIYLGINSSFQDKFYFKLRCFRELSKSDLINYNFEIIKKFNKDYLMGAFIFKDEKEGFGFTLIKKL